MDTLTALLNSKLDIKPSTCRSYCNSINNICKKWESSGLLNGKKHRGFTKENTFRLDKLAKPPDVFAIIEKLKPSAQKNKVSALITVLKAIDEKKYGKAIKIYREKQEQLRADIKDVLNTSKLSEKQDANWTTLADLQSAITYWEDKYDELVKNKMTDANALQKCANCLLMAVLYSGKYIAPVRLEMSDVQIITKKEYDTLSEKTGNYLILKPKNSFFSLNEYKTAKKYGENKFDIPDELADIIRKAKKKSLNKTLLFTCPTNKDTNVSKKNRFGELITETFGSTGKKIYGQILRNIYITEMWSSLRTHSERMKISKQMGTSLEIILSVYQKCVNQDDTCENLTEETPNEDD